jgi:pimeloyl-ACP methyl ester carboxylesterase
MPREQISISGYARTVEALCEHLGLPAVIVVGNSMGGFTAGELAIAFPERVERLVLVSAAGISSTSMRRGPAAALARAMQIVTAQGFRHSPDHPVLVRPRLRHYVVRTIFRHPTRIPTDLLYEMMGGTGKPGFIDQLKANLGYDYRDRIDEIACPTLIVWGREDMITPLADAYEYERLIGDSRLLVIDDTGHVPMAERPLTFNAAVAEFIAERGSARQPDESSPTAVA